MKEYGGYIEFETFHGVLLHETAEALNCERNGLAYLCKTKKIKRIYIPYFLCSSVSNVCKKINVSFAYYSIDEDFMPIFDKELGVGEWIYIVNYYGQLSNEVLLKLKKKYENIIVDNAQSYFQLPIDGIDTLYNCRKYFGVADGAFLYTNQKLIKDLPIDESFERMHYLMGRYERSANEFYEEYVVNNSIFSNEPIKRMSRLTMNLLRGIDYVAVAEQRETNFSILHNAFKDVNELQLDVPYGAFMYPLLIKNGVKIRKDLQKRKIYIPMLWPNVIEICEEGTIEHRFASNILPIPVDQRYEKEDMYYIVEVIKKCIN